MVSRIDPPQMPPSLGTPARRTEEVDTKQAILRHEPDHHRKKKNDDDAPETIDIYEDLSDVSLVALRGFLQNLLAKIDTARSTATQNEPLAGATNTRVPANPKAAAAMQAYQAGAARASGIQTPPPPPIDNAPQSAFDIATLNLDRAELLEIMRDLDRIETAGISAITLEKGDGFLASIRAGISRASASI